MSKIAIITGASSGLGVEFYKHLQGEGLDEIWLIARRLDRLEAVKAELGTVPTRCISMDITAEESILRLREMLENEKPEVSFLINNAGYGVLGRVDESEPMSQGGMIDLNDKALVSMTICALPYMPRHSYIINTCSIASFVPNARMSVYSATKSFVMSFSRSLRYELKNRKINVTAVCPGPMSTEFLAVAGISDGASKAFDRLPRCSPSKTAKGGIRACKKGRAVYTPHIFYKFYRVLSKLLPKSWLIPLAKT